MESSENTFGDSEPKCEVTLTTSATMTSTRSASTALLALTGTTRSFTLSKPHWSGDLTSLWMAHSDQECCGGCKNCSFRCTEPSPSRCSNTVSRQCGFFSLRWSASRSSAIETTALPFHLQYSLIRFFQNFIFDSQFTGFTDLARNGANRFSIRSSSCQHAGKKSAGSCLFSTFSSLDRPDFALAMLDCDSPAIMQLI